MITDTDVKIKYTASPAQEDFTIPFDYQIVEDKKSNVKVWQNGSLLTEGAAAGQYELTNPDADGIYQTVSLVTPADEDDEIVIARSTPLTQEIIVTPTVARDSVDKLTRIVQELSEKVDRCLSTSIYSDASDLELPEPEADTYLGWNADGDAIENKDIDLSTIESDIADNANAISSLIIDVDAVEESLATAEAAVAANTADIATNTDAISDNALDIEANSDDIDTLQTDVADLTSRVQALENFLGVQGSQAILNNQAVAVTIDDFIFDGDDYSSVKIDYEISRNTDTNYKTSVGVLYLVFRGNNVWTTERGLQVVDFDGVTFEISTGAGNIGTVKYTSDDLFGTSYTGGIKYRITKFGA